MNKNLKHILGFAAAFVLAISAYAQDSDSERYTDKDIITRQLAKKNQVEKIDTRKTETYATPLYMFGVSAQFGDTVVYVTELQKIEDAHLTRKYDYLAGRADYSYQLASHLADNYGAKDQTSSVFFDKNVKKLMKRYSKVMNRYLKDNSVRVTIIGLDQFKYKVPEDLSNVVI